MDMAWLVREDMIAEDTRKDENTHFNLAGSARLGHFIIPAFITFHSP
jgi:hypothetical protein